MMKLFHILIWVHGRHMRNMCGVAPLRFVHVSTCIPQLPLNSLILRPAFNQ